LLHFIIYPEQFFFDILILLVLPLFLRTFFLRDIVFGFCPFRSFISKCPSDDFFLQLLLLPLLPHIPHSVMQLLLRFPPFLTVLAIPIIFSFITLQ